MAPEDCVSDCGRGITLNETTNVCNIGFIDPRLSEIPCRTRAATSANCKAC
jgi:hypothetical protein